MANPLLIADCPRCGASAITFDVTAHVLRKQEHGWLNWHEVFSVCRGCHRPSIFLIRMTLSGRDNARGSSEKISRDPAAIMSVTTTLNSVFEVDRYIGLRDNVANSPPKHLPPEIEAAFKEGAACYSIGCYNAAGTMFRLCLDFSSAPLLPDANDTTVAQPTKYQRFNLGARLVWLFDRGILPAALKDLASCIREDGNDGAHAGTLTKTEADDILDFTTVLLDRLFTEPKKLELAEQRRLQRRKQTP